MRWKLFADVGGGEGMRRRRFDSENVRMYPRSSKSTCLFYLSGEGIVMLHRPPPPLPQIHTDITVAVSHFTVHNVMFFLLAGDLF